MQKFRSLGDVVLRGESEAVLAELDLLDRPTTLHAITHYALGNTAKADEILAFFIENYSDTAAFNIATVYGYRGEADKTFEWLNHMLENSDYYPTFILGETAFCSVHSDPRWQPFLEKPDLLEYWLEMPPECGDPGDNPVSICFHPITAPGRVLSIAILLNDIPLFVTCSYSPDGFFSDVMDCKRPTGAL